LLTTATYDPSSETFIINTPEIGAAKWWIGDLGLYCTHAAVYAQLIIDKRRYGVHAFVVPIRDPKTLKVLQGIEAGDVGPKSSFNNKDNGYAIFSNVRIPRQNMLMKYHVVSKEGVYSLQGDEKIAYATMLLTRSGITKILANTISKIVVIATRYSLVRTQFKDSKGQEVPILSYQTQQEKVIPRIA
jgi:acyl-CoA oxidase